MQLERVYSCKFNIIYLFSAAVDGVYYLKSNESSEIYPVYCHMTSLSGKCGGGGWTLVMKLDRDKVKYFTVNDIQILCLFWFISIIYLTQS